MDERATGKKKRRGRKSKRGQKRTRTFSFIREENNITT